MPLHKTLSFRLMVPIVLVLAASIGLSLFWLYSREEKEVIQRAKDETELVNEVIRVGLRNQMLENSKDMTQDTIDRIGRISHVSGIALVSKQGHVRYCADAAQVGRTFDIEHPTCAACHGGGEPGSLNTQLIEAEDGSKLFRTLSVIENEPACQECHEPEHKYLGMLMLDQDLSHDLDRITSVRGSLVGIGLLTLGAVFLTIFGIVHYLIQRPVDKLIKGTRTIRGKNFDTRIDVGVNGEIGELGSAFNDMMADTQVYVQEIADKTFELTMLYSIVERITRSIDLEQLRKIILEIITDAFEDVDRGTIVLKALHGDALDVTSQSAGTEALFEAEIERDGLPQVQHLLSPLTAARWLNGQVKEALASEDGRERVAPLVAGPVDIGLLVVRKRADHTFAEREVHLLDALARHVSVALENARLYALAITDELTQLYTLRFFQQSIVKEVDRYFRYGQKVALLMLDLDDFKHVNDTHGHPAGDAVLMQLAHILKDCVRDVDVVCRYGGEEFAIVLPETDEKAAMVVADRIRSRTEKAIFKTDGGPLRATVSIGVASCPADASSVRDLVEVADEALYRAKEEGKNRAIHYEARPKRA